MTQKVRSLNKIIEFQKQIVKMWEKVSIHSKEYSKLLDNCFSMLLKTMINEDFQLGFYCCGKNDTYHDCAKIAKLRTKSKFCLQELYQKGEISDNEMLMINVDASNQQIEIANRNNITLREIHVHTKAAILKLGKKSFDSLKFLQLAYVSEFIKTKIIICSNCDMPNKSHFDLKY